MYISNKLANSSNNSLVTSIGQRLKARLIKIRWNNAIGCSEAVYETVVDGKTEYAVDTVTQYKREMYLRMCHARPKTLATSLDRPNCTFQLSLSACFGYVAMVYDIYAVLVPYISDNGNIRVRIVETSCTRKA